MLADIEDHYVPSKDKDARVGHKSEDDSFFGYKTHIAMSDERIITAATVTSGEKGDGPQLEELVNQSRANGMAVDTVVGDTAYSGKDNIILSNDEENGFGLVARLNPTISNGARKDEDKFDYNKDAGMFGCPAGHMTIRRAVQDKKGHGKNQSMVYFFDVGKCRLCSRRNGCYREGAKSKTYSVQIKSSEHQQQEAFEKTEEFKTRAKLRYKIEANNSELKNILGYDRAWSHGIDCMRIQGASLWQISRELSSSAKRRPFSFSKRPLIGRFLSSPGRVAIIIQYSKMESSRLGNESFLTYFRFLSSHTTVCRTACTVV